jgi:hypothetical protein
MSAQTPQRFEQAIIVALMQPDARLIQNVEHADEPRADLRRQPDALRLATAQRAALAIQREIAQPDVFEEAQPRANLLDDLARDLELKLCQLESRKKLIRLITDNKQTSMMDRPGMTSEFQVPSFGFRVRFGSPGHLELETRNSVPPNVTAKISGRSRLPSHASQNCGLMNALSRLRVNSLSLSA